MKIPIQSFENVIVFKYLFNLFYILLSFEIYDFADFALQTEV